MFWVERKHYTVKILSYVSNFFQWVTWTINMTRHGDCSALRHLPALYNKRNFCIHVHVYLFVPVHVHLSIGLTVMHNYLKLGVSVSYQFINMSTNKKINCFITKFTTVLCRSQSKVAFAFLLCLIWNKLFVLYFSMLKFSLCRGYCTGRIVCKSSMSK